MYVKSIKFKSCIVFIEKQVAVNMATSMSKRSSKMYLPIWVSLVPLAVCLVYSVFYSASSLGYSLFIFTSRSLAAQTSILSPTMDVGVWGVAIFAILVRLGYDLELNVVQGYFLTKVGTALIIAVCGMAIGAVAVIVGLIGPLALVIISLVLLGLCVLFASDFFGVDLLHFFLGLLLCVAGVFVLVEFAGFLV
jgi:hypothetical protein